jgi:formate dehydrogenase major subunit
VIRVDGREVAPRGTLLDTCAAAGAQVPHFCRGRGLSNGGVCRSCMIEADGRTVAACTTPAEDGMVVRTDTPRLREYRRDLGELIRAESDPAGSVRRTLDGWGVSGTRYRRWRPRGAEDRTHPYVHVDLERCILCRRCVRACAEIQGEFVLAVTGRGSASRLHWAGGSFADSGCVSCGACVEACPTGALFDADRENEPTAAGRTVRTTCAYCGVGCQLDVHVVDDRIAHVSAAEAPVNRGHLCVKGRYAHGFSRHPDRLTTPLVRRDGGLEPATWEEAVTIVGREFTRLRGRVAGLSSARCTNEENYLVQKWMRAGLGTHDVDCCARVCHAPSAAGLREAFGAGVATGCLDDIERADLLLVVGANVTGSHPVAGARIRQAVLAGTRLVVVDPRRTELAELADVHLALKPGTNVALLNAIACAMVEAGLVNRGFVSGRVDGWAAFEPFVRTQTPERFEAVTGVPAAAVREAAWLYGTAERPLALHGLGLTEHHQGREGVLALCNLALLAGAVGRPGAGVNALPGQNNVQGAVDMGCQPDRLPGDLDPADPAARERFERAWGRPLPATPGRNRFEIYAAAERGEIRGLFIQGEDVIRTDPDSTRTRRALESLECLVVQELFLTETARLAHVVLPAAGAFEKDGTFTSAERRIQRVRATVPPLAGTKPDWEALCDLMAATGYPQSVAGPGEILDEIARLVPEYAGVSFARLEEGGLQWPVPDAAHPGTPVLHERGFPRGRGRLTPVEHVRSPGLGPGLTLVTGRTLAHHNAGTMTRRSRNRLLHPADELEIHPNDASSRGIGDGDPVIVSSTRGHARAIARVTGRVPAGVVFLTFHHPETGANEVTGEVHDRATGCPEYKATAVEVKRL